MVSPSQSALADGECCPVLLCFPKSLMDMIGYVQRLPVDLQGGDDGGD